jgi:hypothetical protein
MEGVATCSTPIGYDNGHVMMMYGSLFFFGQLVTII